MTPMAAARAYGAIQKQAQSGFAGETAKPTAGASFAHILQQMVDTTAGTTRAAENAMAGHAQGKTELIDAVTAVASAQANLETVISIRDSVISAYQEILRMPI